MLSVSDVDAGDNPVLVASEANHGVLTLGGTAGLDFVVGDGAAGRYNDLQGAHRGHQYGPERAAFQPPANFTGSTTLRLTINDLGNTGTGGPISTLIWWPSPSGR